jgi:hypothetical protein
VAHDPVRPRVDDLMALGAADLVRIEPPELADGHEAEAEARHENYQPARLHTDVDRRRQPQRGCQGHRPRERVEPQRPAILAALVVGRHP